MAKVTMPEEPQVERRSVASAALLVEGGLALFALALGWLLGLPLLAHVEWSLIGLALGLLATLPLAVGLVLLNRWPPGPFKRLNAVMRESILPLFRRSSLGELLVISVAAGVGEELLFRGVAQLTIERASGSAWLAVLVASVIFGLAHPMTKTYAVLAGLIGIYFGCLLVATDNLLVPIVTHAAYDFFALVYLLRDSRNEMAD